MVPHIGDTQVAWQLLLYTAAPRAQFALRTSAPGLTREFAVAHDAAVLDTLGALLCAEERSSLPPAASRVAQLALRHGGLGLRSAALHAPTLFFLRRRGQMHSVFCPFGRHPSDKVWHRSWIPASFLPALRSATCSKPLTCSSKDSFDDERAANFPREAVGAALGRQSGMVSCFRTTIASSEA